MDTKTYSLPPVGQLFKDSWTTFTQSILSLFIIDIIGVIFWIVSAGVSVLIFILSGAGSAILKNGFQGLITNLKTNPPEAFSALSVLSIITIVVILFSAIIGAALQTASILIVDKNGKTPIGGSITKSLGFVIPLFLVGIITFILVFGAFFVLILPAILFYFLLAFTQFEVILNNQRLFGAVKRSVLLTGKHFGSILIRLILLFLIYVTFSVVVNLISNAGPDTAILMGIVSFIGNMLLGWFSLAYTITLYKQAKVGIENTPGKGIGWMWVISILGWLIAIGLGFVTYKTISSGILDNFINKNSPGKSIQRSINEMDPEAKVQYELSAQLFKQMRENQDNPEAVKKINDQNITALKKALELEPDNPKIWFELGNAYTWISSQGRLEESLSAFQKAAALEPENTIYLDNVAEILIRMKNYDQAVLELQKSLRISQESGDESGFTHYRLGVAYAGLKIYDASREHLQKAIEILTKNNKDGTFDDSILRAQKDLSLLPK